MDNNDMCIHLSRSYVRHLGHLVYKQNKKLLQIISKQENIPIQDLMNFLKEQHKTEYLSPYLLKKKT